VAEGATLQIGLGALADAVLAALGEHRGLAVHSGMISDGIADLAAGGALTGTGHPLFPGRIVTGLVGGSKRAFDFVDRNPDVVTVPSSISHGPDVISRLPRFTAVNSAVEIALDGSMNGEMIGERVISGPGGARDYAMAAAAGVDGRFIVTLPATAGAGAISRIVSRLADGVTTTVEGRYVTTVVTEHGVAEIGPLSGRARADAMRAIADERFVAGLTPGAESPSA
jgi:acetyl-CoA hydrolase